MHEICKNCNAACCRGYFTQSSIKIISIRDEDKVPEYMTQWNKSHTCKIMKTDINGVCIALDKNTNLCTIYKYRPKVCKNMKPNSMQCNTSRRNMEKQYGAGN